MSTVEKLSEAYYTARGFNTDTWGRPTGKKLLEEASELLEAIAIDGVAPTHDAAMNLFYEVADVAICLAYIAKWNGFTIEEAIQAKTLKDTGRG